jgi:MinD-like ATPase involved in chromosome partitioning or flagellar assembly
VVGRGVLVAVSGPRGSGVTEVALGLAAAFVDRGRTTLLVDAHEAAPALAGRLGLALEPNLRSAVDACVHGLGSFSDSVVTAPSRGGALRAITGFPSAIAAAPVSTDDVLTVLDHARRDHDVVVIDVEERTPTGRAVMSVADALVGVVGASPVGVVRAMEWASDVLGRGAPAPHVVVNRAPGSRFRQDEIRAELGRAVPTVSLTWSPHDAAVDSAAWDGAVVGRGGFRAACSRLAGAVDPTVGPRSARGWRRSR